MATRDEVLQSITAIFRKELNEPDLQLDFTSSASTVEKWDSINNLILISAIEDHYQISFPVDFIFDAENVGDLCDYIVANPK